MKKTKKNVVMGATAKQIEFGVGVTAADRRAVRRVLEKCALTNCIERAANPR